MSNPISTILNKLGWYHQKAISLNDPTVSISLPEIEAVIRANCAVASSIEFFNTDPGYKAISEADLVNIVNASPSRRYAYVPEDRDCDDFVRIFRGWLSELGYGNLVFAKCLIKMDGSQHAMVLAIIHTPKGFACRYIEPQSNSIFQHISGEIYFLEV